ncbi:MAG TPA: hypothetical protein PK581_09215 [Caldisericia bacterium]|nr:hypothetical protein [Caldisericia bacterium]
MNKAKNNRIDNLRSTKANASLLSLVVNKRNIFENCKCASRKDFHKVVVIFSEKRLENSFYQRCNEAFASFATGIDYSIIPSHEKSGLNKVEYCKCGKRRTSMSNATLWTAYKPISSHLVTRTDQLMVNTSSAINERGNMRYIAKFRLMKGENA